MYYVKRCPACRRANVPEPLANRAIALLESRDRVEGAKTADELIKAANACDLHASEIEKELQRVREYVDPRRREAVVAASRRPAEFVVAANRSDPPPPEFAEFKAWLGRVHRSQSTSTTVAVSSPPSTPTPLSITGRTSTASEGKIGGTVLLADAVRARLERLPPLLAVLATSDCPTRMWESKLVELIDQDPFDTESARSFAEGLAYTAHAWRKRDPRRADAIHQIAVECRDLIEATREITPTSSRASEPPTRAAIARGAKA